MSSAGGYFEARIGRAVGASPRVLNSGALAQYRQGAGGVQDFTRLPRVSHYLLPELTGWKGKMVVRGIRIRSSGERRVSRKMEGWAS